MQIGSGVALKRAESRIRNTALHCMSGKLKSLPQKLMGILLTSVYQMFADHLELLINFNRLDGVGILGLLIGARQQADRTRRISWSEKKNTSHLFRKCSLRAGIVAQLARAGIAHGYKEGSNSSWVYRGRE
jgi:hypothetical protein